MKILNKILSTLVISLLALPFQFTAFATSEKSIEVGVRTSSDVGVPGIKITLVGPSSFSETQTTDSDGESMFEITNNGEYTATISLPTSSSWELEEDEESSKSVNITDSSAVKTMEFLVQKKDLEEEEEEPESETPEILSVKLPSAFTKSGSTTTDLSKLNKDTLDEVKNFTLDDPDFNKIVFIDPIDLSDSELAEKFEELDEYVSISELGRVSVDSDELPELNKKAQITMRGLNLVTGSVPKITEDGHASSKISKIKYDGTNLTFEVAAFSAYIYTPTLEIFNEEETTDKAEFILTGHVDDLDSKIDIYLHEEKVGESIEPDRNGDFEFEYTLEEKENDFKIIAISENGQTDEANYSIEFTGAVVEEPVDEARQIPFLLVLAIVLGIAIIVWAIIYFVKKSKKKKGNSIIDTELKDLEQDNPKIPEAEIEDLEATTGIGQTDLTDITKEDK